MASYPPGFREIKSAQERLAAAKTQMKASKTLLLLVQAHNALIAHADFTQCNCLQGSAKAVLAEARKSMEDARLEVQVAAKLVGEAEKRWEVIVRRVVRRRMRHC